MYNLSKFIYFFSPRETNKNVSEFQQTQHQMFIINITSGKKVLIYYNEVKTVPNQTAKPAT